MSEAEQSRQWLDLTDVALRGRRRRQVLVVARGSGPADRVLEGSHQPGELTPLAASSSPPSMSTIELEAPPCAGKTCVTV